MKESPIAKVANPSRKAGPPPLCDAPMCGDKIKDDECWTDGEHYYHDGCLEDGERKGWRWR